MHIINFTFLVAALNSMFLVFMTLSSLKKKRLISVYYFLICYFSIFFCYLSIHGPFKKYRGFTGDYISVTENTIFFCVIFSFGFNILFALSEQFVWSLLSKKTSITWSLPKTKVVSVTRFVYGVMLIISGTLYFVKMQGVGYRGYVEYEGSNWPSVFFNASSVFITFSALQKKYVSALIAIVPFLYFVFDHHVRSYALVSLIPATVIFFYKIYLEDSKKTKLKSSAVGLLVFLVLLIVSFVSDYLKTGKYNFPDSGMPFGFAAMVQKTIEIQYYTEWNSLQIYFFNILKPFYKLLGLKLPDMMDTPVYMAWLIDGVPKSWNVYFHYPALIYADAFVSFGRAGVFLGLLWGAVCSIMEIFMAKSRYFLGIFLPIYIWHTYMLCRGSIAIAAGPFSYVFYVLIILGLIIHFFFRQRKL